MRSLRRSSSPDAAPPEGGYKKLRLRSRMALILGSLVALSGFAFYVTAADGWALLQVSRQDAAVGRPTKNLVVELQRERLASAKAAGQPRGAAMAELTRQRSRTDKVVADWRQSSAKAGGSDIERLVHEIDQQLQKLRVARQAVDGRQADLVTVTRPYSDIIAEAWSINYKLSELDDQSLARDARGLIMLTQAREAISREDALVAGTLAAGKLGSIEQLQIAQAIGSARSELQSAYERLAEGDKARHNALVRSSAYTQLRWLEDKLLAARPVEKSAERSSGSSSQNNTSSGSASQNNASSGDKTPTDGAQSGSSRKARTTPPVTPSQWQSAAQPVLTQMDQAIDAGGDDIVRRATPVGIGVALTFLIAGVLGLAATVGSILMARAISRTLLRRLHDLTVAARELANDRLPAVVRDLAAGQEVDVATAAPALPEAHDEGDEFGQVAAALNAAAQAAISAAIAQNEQRQAFLRALRDQALRTQGHMNVAYKHLDEVERHRGLGQNRQAANLPVTEADIELFGLVMELDLALTAAQRPLRNATLLAGGTPARGNAETIALVDVIRTAQSQLTDYRRVVLEGDIHQLWVSGYASDISIMLAELLSNGLRYSPPSTTVEVSTVRVARGLTIVISDKGLGMSAEQLAEANAKLSSPSPAESLMKSSQYGLVVAGMIAARHGIEVSLERSGYGGVNAYVILPSELLQHQPTRQTARAAAAPAPTAGAEGEGGRVMVLTKPEQAKAPQPFPRSGGDQSGALIKLDPRPETRPLPAVPADDAADPEQEGPAGHDGRQADAKTTEHGLPVRTPQASLNQNLATDEPLLPEEEATEDAGRSPDEIRKIFGGFQKGTQQGRENAAREAGQDEPEPPAPAS